MSYETKQTFRPLLKKHNLKKKVKKVNKAKKELRKLRRTKRAV